MPDLVSLYLPTTSVGEINGGLCVSLDRDVNEIIRVVKLAPGGMESSSVRPKRLVALPDSRIGGVQSCFDLTYVINV